MRKISKGFLFTDVVESSRRWEDKPETMGQDIADHFAAIGIVVAEHGGQVFKTVGDAVFAAFNSGEAALAVANQLLTTEVGLPIRMAVTEGLVEPRDGDFFGSALNLAARLLQLGEPGRVLTQLSESPIALRRLGQVTVKGFAEPALVHEIIVDLPPLVLPCSGPVELPQRLTPVLGREEFLAQLRELILAHRLLTLTGFGGSGKTCLAVELARRVQAHFPGGVFFVPLADLAASTNVVELTTVLDAVIQRAEPNRTLLLVVDNCEHLVREAARAVQQLLELNPNCTILATSRSALGVTGQRNFLVPSLPTEPESSAVDLFLSRAEEASGEPVTDRELASRICQAVDGIPLGIELAAARCQSFSLAQVYERMKSSSKFLRQDSNLVERHQAMERVIDWSYQLLSPATQEAMVRLCVMSGGFDYWGAHALIGDDDPDHTDAVLEELVRSNLLARTNIRYRFLEPVREFGFGLLEQDAAGLERAKNSLVDYVENLAWEAKPHLGSAEQNEWFSRLAAEHPNTRAAFTWIVDPLRRANLAVTLHGFWLNTGRAREGRSWAEAAVSRVPEADVTFDIHSMAGVLAWAERDLESADRHLALALSKIDDGMAAESQVKVLNNRGLVLATLGKFEAAGDLFERAETIARGAGEITLVATVLCNRGRLASEQADYHSAEHLLRDSMDLADKQGDAVLSARARDSLAGTLRLSGNGRECVRLLELSLDSTWQREDQQSYLGLACLLCLAAEDCGFDASPELSDIIAHSRRLDAPLQIVSKADQDRLAALRMDDDLTLDLTDDLLRRLHSLARKVTRA